MDDLLSLLPEVRGLGVQGLQMDHQEKQVHVFLDIRTPRTRCAHCGVYADRIHSRYQRTLADLPWADYAVQLHLRVREFYCDNDSCPRRIFCERLPTLAAPRLRRTLRFARRHYWFGLALGGAAAARLAQRMGYGGSRNAFLRALRCAPKLETRTPRVLGVDDWAQRKRYTYGSILMDLERRRPIGLLADRDAPTLAAWLRTHPGVEIVCRDRAGAYAEGARDGAPRARQVADRFHLVQNVADALLQVFEAHRTLLRQLSTSLAPRSAGVEKTKEAALQVSRSPTPVAVLPRASSPLVVQRRHQRRKVYEQIQGLHKQGWPLTAIAEQVGLHRKTVAIYARADRVPERPRPLSILDPYKPYLLDRWNAGCWTGTQLYKEIKAQGYPGKRTAVLIYIGQLRKTLGLPPGIRAASAVPVLCDPTIRPVTARQVTWAVLRPVKRLTEREQQILKLLDDGPPEIREALTLARAFVTLLRTRQADGLASWVRGAAKSTVKAFARLAKSFRRDYAAIKAGLSLPWSTGPVEGQINRLKMLKRQMFGRASLDLLETRLIHPL